MEHDIASECIFCKIIHNKETSFILYEDKKFIAFLDKRPVFLGHSLLLPKAHFHTLYDFPSTSAKSFFLLLQKLGKAVEVGMEAEGSFIANNNIVSQSVPHFHMHIIPRNKHDGLRGFFWPRQKYESEKQMLEVRNKIRQALII